SGDGHNRLKNWPGVTDSALGEASTTRYLYSAFTQSCDTTGQSDSSAGIGDAAAPLAMACLLTTVGADANGSPFMDRILRSRLIAAVVQDSNGPGLYQNQDLFQILNRRHTRVLSASYVDFRGDSGELCRHDRRGGLGVRLPIGL